MDPDSMFKSFTDEKLCFKLSDPITISRCQDETPKRQAEEVESSEMQLEMQELQAANRRRRKRKRWTLVFFFKVPGFFVVLIDERTNCWDSRQRYGDIVVKCMRYAIE